MVEEDTVVAEEDQRVAVTSNYRSIKHAAPAITREYMRVLGKELLLVLLTLLWLSSEKTDLI